MTDRPQFTSPRPVHEHPSHPSLVHGVTQAMAADHDSVHVFDDRIAWGAMSVKLSRLAPHFLAMGATGSGKSTLLKLLMMSVLPATDEAHALRYRALLYDPKPEFYTSLRGMGVENDRIILTNPYDARSSAWDIASDVVTSAQADELAEALVPVQSNERTRSDEVFWEAAANQTCRGVVLGLQARSPKRWDVRDLAIGCTSASVRDTLLSKSEFGRTVKAKFFGTQHRHAPGIDAQLMSRVGWLLTVGDLWRHAPHRFTFTGWTRSAAVLMVSRFPAAPIAINRVNHLLMKWAFTSLLELPEGGDLRHDRTWVFIDELTQAGRFPGFSQFLRMTRSKGVHVGLAFQDSSGLSTAFPKDEVASIINQCGNRTTFLMNSYQECEFASKLFAFHEAQRQSTTFGQGRAVSYTTQPETRPVVAPEEIQRLRSVQQLAGGFEAYFHTQTAGTFRQEMSAAQRAILLRSVDNACPHSWPGYVPRPANELSEITCSDEVVSRPSTTGSINPPATARDDGDDSWKEDQSTPVSSQSPAWSRRQLSLNPLELKQP